MSHFDKIVVLNVPSATERWEQTVRELLRIGITEYTRFAAVTADNPRISFNLSMIGILSLCAFDCRNFLIIEDDVIFGRSAGIVKRRMSAALDELPPDWDVLYLGANLYVDGFKTPTRYSDHLCRVYNAWTTHAVAFSSKAARWLLTQNPPTTDNMFDGWLSSKLESLNAFCVTPMIAFQRAGDSLIWGRKVNYNDIFLHTNVILTTAK